MADPFYTIIIVYLAEPTTTAEPDYVVFQFNTYNISLEEGSSGISVRLSLFLVYF